MKYLIIVLLMLFGLTSYAQDHYTQQVEAIISEIEDKGPGVSIGIVQDGELTYSFQKGKANLNYEIPITEETAFRIASASKQFTAAAIIHLRQSGLLELSNTVSQYFPEWSNNIGKVTIQQLLNHTSGIRDYMSMMMIQESRQIDFLNSFTGTDADILELLAKQEDLAFDAGTQHSYSNTNYIILAQIVKKVSKLSLGEYTLKHIFKPLQMNSTSYRENTRAVLPFKAHGYVSPCPECERFEYHYTSNSVGDGGVVTTLNDLAIWENEYHNQKVLNTESWNLMTKKGQLQNGEKIDYAAGLIIGEHQGRPIIHHSGMNPGFASNLIKFPKDNLSIIVLGNQNWYDVHAYAFRVADIFLGIIPAAPASPKMPTSKPILLSDEELNKFCGDYIFKETGEFRSIVNTPDGLIYVRKNGPTSRLVPLSSTSLTFEDRQNVTLEFTFNEDDTKSIAWRSDQGNQNASSYLKTTTSSIKDIAAYAGNYYCKDLEKTLTVDLMNGQLKTQFLGQEVMLDSFLKDQFEIMGMIKLRFERNMDGDIYGFRLDAPRAENLLFKKAK